LLEVAGQLVEISPAVDLIARLVRVFGRERAHEVVDDVLDALSNVDGAALAHDWTLWARPKQRPRGDWVSWGSLTGRGFGKTYALSKFINEEVELGRARLIGLAAQDEANALALQVHGPSGLIATAPPWFRPIWEATPMQLVWPNGARAIVRTPEVPGKIRGFDYDLTWLSELQSWPNTTREEAFSNFRLATRVGLARTIWDATPKRRHPLLRELLTENERDPDRYVVIRGTTHENAINLADGYIEELDRKYGGTLKGREELLGEFLDHAEGALIRQEWIDAARRHLPERLKRRVIAIDPAVTTRAGNDKTGIIEAGLGLDDQAYILADHSGKHAPSKWADLVLDAYVRGACDCVVVETNKGGELVTQNLRAHGSSKGLNVVVIGKEGRPRHIPGTVYVKEVHARGPKEDRAQPLATAYERGRVSHVVGADLAGLEDLLTTWEPIPGQRSPDALDACVHAVVEILGLVRNAPNYAGGFKGIAELGKQLTQAAPTNIATLLGGGGGQDRI
jgi:phage terminase large subunit-like protein